MGKRIDVPSIIPVIGTDYPLPFDQQCRTRERRKLGDQADLTQFGPAKSSSSLIMGSRCSTSVTPPVSRQATATVTACKTGLTVMPASWRSAHALRRTSDTTRALTWWRLQTGARCLIRIETAHPIRHWDGEGSAVMSGVNSADHGRWDS
jgi:hypothetical protein